MNNTQVTILKNYKDGQYVHLIHSGKSVEEFDFGDDLLLPMLLHLADPKNRNEDVQPIHDDVEVYYQALQILFEIIQDKM